MAIYIVSGDGLRCGSTMMMEALRTGGLPIYYDKEITVHTPTPVYEVTSLTQAQLGFPDPKKLDNHLFKLFPLPWGALTQVVAGDYKMVWMHRPARQRWRSTVKWFREMDEQMGTPPRTFPKSKQRYFDQRTQEGLGILKQRKDFHITEFEYIHVVATPLEAFTQLQGAGWPINPEISATVPTAGTNQSALDTIDVTADGHLL